MIITIITNTNSGKQWEGRHQTLSEAETWLNKQILLPYRNIEQKWFKEKDLNEYQISIAIDERLIEIEPDVYIKEYLLPAQATYTQEDKTSEMQREVNKESKKFKGNIFRQLSQNVLDIVSGHVFNNNLTGQQIENLKQSPPYRYLLENMPLTAKPLIDALIPDGVILTQLILDDINLEYQKYKTLYPEIVIY